MSRLDPALARGLAAIEPYLDVVVVAGGWVPHVYELLYDAGTAGRSPRTRDIDLALPRSVPVRSRSIDELLKSANFRCEFHSLDSPPVTKYVATQGDDDIEIEFITDAPGASEAAIMVQPDLTAQELHYVGLLLDSPQVSCVQESPGPAQSGKGSLLRLLRAGCISGVVRGDRRGTGAPRRAEAGMVQEEPQEPERDLRRAGV